MNTQRGLPYIGPEEPVPWPHLTIKAAAITLGVSEELVYGLAVRGRIEAVRTVTMHGSPRTLLRASAVEALVRTMSGAQENDRSH